ncbi:MAG: urease accessory protein UreF [Acaryochloridaceae cyanobacterium SU_2_1]|nr:urease accessory protein UreF [Acaryochloridaceae cyanobacterium SU_2_1]
MPILDDDVLLRLLQLTSPTLPVGGYSYSEGLEFLVDNSVITQSTDLQHWLTQEITTGAARLEAAVMVRSYRATERQDYAALQAWNQWLSAARETEELRRQSWQMGGSLLQLLLTLPPRVQDPNHSLDDHPLKPFDQLFPLGECNFAIAFGCTAALWQIPLKASLLGYLHSWVTNLVGAGVKLIPLGQTTGQELLMSLQETIAKAAPSILNLSDDELCSCGWGLALASMAHETQYSRLFGVNSLPSSTR